MPLQEDSWGLFCPVLLSAGTTAPRSEEPTAPKLFHGEFPIIQTSIAAGCIIVSFAARILSFVARILSFAAHVLIFAIIRTPLA